MTQDLFLMLHLEESNLRSGGFTFDQMIEAIGGLEKITMNLNKQFNDLNISTLLKPF